MGMLKNWKFKNLSSTDSSDASLSNAATERATWSERLEISPVLVNILLLRGCTSLEDMDVFLSPHLRLLAPPEQWPGVVEAAEILSQCLINGAPFLVWGDYDVDGITASALVLDVLEGHGIPARHHLPDRREEGYGLNIPMLEKFAAEGVKVLLTVDCGISDVNAVTRARELGMTIIISDHHLPPAVLPPAHAICNPRLAPCPCPQLAGVGVAFFLMAAVNARLEVHTGRRFDMREVLDLVALGTLADVVRLTGQNRILAKNGLLKIANPQRIGMMALKTISGFTLSASLGGGQVVFSICPRINAAGRMGLAAMALALLRSKSHEEAARLAQKLDDLNTERRAEEERIQKEARIEALKYSDKASLVLHGKDWHPGVIGIVASRIVDEFYKPTLILCDDAHNIKGSGRSVNEFDLHAGLSDIADVFLTYGGHKQAAGMRLDAQRLEELRQRFEASVCTAIGSAPLAPTVMLDGTLDFAQASDLVFLQELELLQPFGAGNAEPVFASPPLLVKNRRVFGRGREHLSLELLDESTGISLHAKAWRQAATMPESLQGTRIRLAYAPRIDKYNGISNVDIRIKDWKKEK
ncbi:MAG: single-stranded-DNA-specific exonuclease RecJ [Desulfovibrionaceae bacterium]